ncbi:bifunctional DNA-formamidopyrimidine glycosylase/DNA-(apurinic or apyrimidinic site) lyase [Labedella populi]|uniref:Bifunctional DNA-formamidopyrimidine glycosylase/DNA-(Apurinic or apyrimidinic site) lyase n=1 Tax=Labedella populi TaxID=2498850 RepID=A0A3S3ZJW5_9MICO|nr:bifunctional DNA-formamidopyrimidine glycosylase/DNA-(apurinic or apyrimidinic site) lyase [Labedella populi]RWZ61136.1 bifunctional DNA-formamidopyrimidine glycosylase/DNA-(apurinic or apyrimidinic site) lyase [Labedella populi]
MPELPEVEVVRAGLAPAVTRATVTGVDVLDRRSLRRHVGAPFEGDLTGRTIESAVRRGKFLWFPLDDGRSLVAHLGMSGQMLLRRPGDTDRFTRVALGIEHPVHGELLVNFADQRIFGGLAIDPLVPTVDGRPGGHAGDATADPVVPERVAHIARDALDPHFDDHAFDRRVRNSRSGIKRILLDQSAISGIGNIYADESLWAAMIAPEQPGVTLSSAQVELLLDEVRAVLRRALAEGGTSFDAQYVNVNGQAGYFAHSLNAYGRHGKPCTRCGSPIVRVAFANRSSHYCPVCQPLR